MNTWFVSTVKKAPGQPHFDVIWAMEEFETEAAARRYAKHALNGTVKANEYRSFSASNLAERVGDS